MSRPGPGPGPGSTHLGSGLFLVVFFLPLTRGFLGDTPFDHGGLPALLPENGSETGAVVVWTCLLLVSVRVHSRGDFPRTPSVSVINVHLFPNLGFSL